MCFGPTSYFVKCAMGNARIEGLARQDSALFEAAAEVVRERSEKVSPCFAPAYRLAALGRHRFMGGEFACST